jgi:hypothetical protein
MMVSDVENAIQKWDIKVMVNKQLDDKVLKLSFHEKNSYSNLVTVIKGIEADVLMCRDMIGSQGIINIAASTLIAGTSYHMEW